MTKSKIEFNIGWAIMFKKEGLDINGVRNYLSEVDGTEVVDVVEETLTFGNTRTGKDEEIPCIIFLMKTDGMWIPLRYRLELNLRETDQKYVYMAMER